MNRSMSHAPIPFARPCITDREREAVDQVLRSGWLTTGPRTKEFETLFARYVGAEDALALNSCTAALHLGLLAGGVKPGDDVLVPSLTFAASAEIAYYFGARPVLTDVDRDTHNVTINDLERARTPKTRAVVVVHFGGAACDIEAIAGWCRDQGLLLIEDCAHATETMVGGRHVGTFGDVGCYSFYANKNLATGEGGMVVCRDPKALERARLLSLHGMSKDAWKRFEVGAKWRYDIVDAGFKYNLTDVASAMGLVQLSRLEEMAIKRRRIHETYRRELSGVRGLSFQIMDRYGTPAHHLSLLRVDEEVTARDQLVDHLSSGGIGVSVHYIPLHRMSFYAAQGYRPEDFPNSDWIGRTTFSLPLYPDLSESDQARVIEAVKKNVARA